MFSAGPGLAHINCCRLCCIVRIFFPELGHIFNTPQKKFRQHILIIFFHGSIAPVGQGPLLLEVPRSHSDTTHSVDSSGQVIGPSQTLVSVQHITLTTDIHAPGGIRTHNPSKRTGADPCCRPRGNLDRFINIYDIFVNCNWIVTRWQ